MSSVYWIRQAMSVAHRPRQCQYGPIQDRYRHVQTVHFFQYDLSRSRQGSSRERDATNRRFFCTIGGAGSSAGSLHHKHGEEHRLKDHHKPRIAIPAHQSNNASKRRCIKRIKRSPSSVHCNEQNGSSVVASARIGPFVPCWLSDGQCSFVATTAIVVVVTFCCAH